MWTKVDVLEQQNSPSRAFAAGSKIDATLCGKQCCQHFFLVDKVCQLWL